jgi:uncharacterized integral membrane protein (TIGR00698 family)
MEGLDAPAGNAVYLPPTRKSLPLWYGYAAAAVISAIAFTINSFFRTVPTPILAIALGVLIRNIPAIPGEAFEGCKGLMRKTIPLTIILTGATLNLADFARGLPYVVVVILAVAVGTFAAIGAGKLLKLNLRTSMLIGAGTSICGNSAVVAVAPVIKAEDDDLLLSLSSINILGLLIMLVLPLAGGALHMSPEAFGVWAGSTVHAVPQAVTTGYTFGPQSGVLATLVKLIRVSLLAPYVLLLAFLTHRESPAAGPIRYASLLPPFLWGFLGFAVLNTLGLLPVMTIHPLGISRSFQFDSNKVIAEASSILLTLSMAAMGLEVHLKRLIRSGGPALLAGLAASLLQCAATWILIRLLL